jgi:hypothetical protein
MKYLCRQNTDHRRCEVFMEVAMEGIVAWDVTFLKKLKLSL